MQSLHTSTPMAGNHTCEGPEADVLFGVADLSTPTPEIDENEVTPLIRLLRGGIRSAEKGVLSAPQLMAAE